MSEPRATLLATLLLLLLGGAFGELEGQAPLFLVNAETEVASVGFRHPEGRALEGGTLQRQIALSDPGFAHWVRSVLGILPLVPSPERQRFSPPTLLRDRTRLLRSYRDAGFPDASVEYEVRLDTAANAVDVTFVIREGPPLLLEAVVVEGSDGGELRPALPEELHPGWVAFEGTLTAFEGRRLSRSLRLRLQDRVGNWLRDRGYPQPTVSTDVVGVEGGARLHLVAEPGPRMRVGRVRVEGNRRLSDEVILRQVPLRSGDWFSRARLAEGQSQLFGLDMVRIAMTRVEPPVEGDSVDVSLRITEGSLRLLSGRVGYTARWGLSADGSWSHRDFLGGARTFEVAALARTGVLATEAADRRYGVSMTLRQPWLFDHRVQGLLRPFVEYRDDVRDESVQWGAEATALYQRGTRRNVALRYSLISRRVLEAGVGAVLGEGVDLPGVLAGLDTLDLDRRTSSFGATGRWARVPGWEGRSRMDWSVFGSLEVAGPAGLSTVEYGRIVAEVAGVVPLGDVVSVRGRLGGGRVLPFGVSVPAPDGSNRLESYLKLRDAVLTAGGASDVRGWGSELLGPKSPDLGVGEGAASSSGRYIPLGGLARWTGSVQLEVPLPLLGRPHGLHAFLDAGRVWTPDGRFLPTERPLVPGQAGAEARFGTGVGLSISTPVGPVQLDVGYKINPSLLDLRDPAAVGRALLDGLPVEEVPEESLRRWHLHLSIGGLS